MIKNFFDRWWIIVVYTVICDILYIVSLINDYEQLERISYIMLIFAFLLLFVSTVYQFIKNRLVKGIISGVLLMMTIYAYSIYFVISLAFNLIYSEDSFADSLTVPTDIVIEYPNDLTFNDDQRPDSILNIQRDHTDFVLYNSFQPGLFEYDLWIGNIEAGDIYLKAYEITQDIRLSSDRIKERSTVKVFNSSDSLIRFGTTSHFTIYEGDWGEPYAARFEVWYKADNSKKERKIIEKNFIIEGWMR